VRRQTREKRGDDGGRMEWRGDDCKSPSQTAAAPSSANRNSNCRVQISNPNNPSSDAEGCGWRTTAVCRVLRERRVSPTSPRLRSARGEFRERRVWENERWVEGVRVWFIN
jgi:hypothetical protein